MKPNLLNPPSNKPKNVIQAMSSIIRYGKDLLEFIALRPYLTVQLLFAALEVFFPIEASILTNEEIIRKFLEDGEYRLKEVTAKQYKSHLKQLNRWLNGPRFMLVTPALIEKFIRGKTIEKRTHLNDKVGQSSHDHLIDVYHNFYEFMLGRGYLCRLMPNPVQLRRIGNKRKVPNEKLIFKAREYQHIMNEVPWAAIPTLLMIMAQGVRPQTAPRVQHSDFKRPNKNIYLNAKINKRGKAYPVLTPALMAQYAPWENCTGPVSSDRLVKLVQDTIKRLGYRKEFNDDCRKTAISMRLAILRHDDPAGAEEKAKREFGNDKTVRDLFYEAEQPYEEAVAFFSVTRTLPDIITISVAEARTFRAHQIKAAGDVGVALSESEHGHTHTSSKTKKRYIRRMAELNAQESLSPNNLFPSFIKIDGDWEITRPEPKIDQDMADDKQAAILETLNELHGNEGNQLSIFHGRAELFLDSAISKPCSPNQTPSLSPNSSSAADTESA